MSSVLTTMNAVRVWVIAVPGWRPQSPDEVPPSGVAVALADERCMSAAEASEFVAGFNREMLAQSQPHWAIARPVILRVTGDLTAGEAWSAASGRSS